MKKYCFVILIVFIIFSFMIIDYYIFEMKIRNFFGDKKINIELTSTGWINNDEFKYNKNISIFSQIEDIFNWEMSMDEFERGGEYPYLVFKLESSKGETLFVDIILHNSKQSLKIIISQNKKQIEYTKKIEIYDVLEEIFKKIRCEKNP